MGLSERYDAILIFKLKLKLKTVITKKMSHVHTEYRVSSACIYFAVISKIW